MLALQVNQPYTVFIIGHKRLAYRNCGQLLFLGLLLDVVAQQLMEEVF